jgi:Oxidoreductase molybdopterin binding domain
MSPRRTNLALLVVLVAALVSGGLAFAAGAGRPRPGRAGPRHRRAGRAGGRPLAAGHGFPARLVAPGRRGFWWVKWVVSIEVDRAPWWRQPPFPLT